MFPEHPVHDLADLRRKALDLCASLAERIAEARGGAGDTPAPEEYAALAMGEVSSPHYNALPEELLATSAAIAAKRSHVLPLYNRFTLAWLILNCDPARAALRVPRSILALYPVHFARMMLQMELLDDEAYDLATDAYVKEVATLLFKLLPIGEEFVDVHCGPSRKILWRGGPLQGLRALWVLYAKLHGTGPVLVGHNHILSMGTNSEVGFVTGHHRVADLIAANALLKALVGRSWILDPALEFITPHHSIRCRVVARNGGSMFRLGHDEVSTSQALATSRTRRRLYEEGKYVPAKYMRIWPRDAMVAWSRRSRLASWGEVGMESRIPPPQHYGRTRGAELLDVPAGASGPRRGRGEARPALATEGELCRQAGELCESLRSRITSSTGAQIDAIQPQKYAALALLPPSTTRYREPPAELVAAESRIVSTSPELAGLYNRFALAWLILHADPDSATLRLPTSVQQVVPLHIARVLRQMTSLEDTHYSLHNDEFLKDLAVLSFRLVPLGEFSVDLSSGPGRRKLLKCRPVSFVQALRVLRLGAGGLTPIFQAYTHTLAGGRGGKDYLDTSHRLADLAAANPHVKGVVGEAWMEDPNLEFITPHHSLRGRLAASNGGALLRVGCDEVSTALALETSTTRRQLWEEGKYVPTSYMRIWPRHGIVRWSERTRPGSWGPVGLDSRVPPPEWLGRRRRG